ncbi:MAG: hypothetical protein EOP38_12245 [Rubrivivax sp.]|nr:MAG: hypothetical protein EOP38_12245 [Rubrivivax sp.]
MKPSPKKRKGNDTQVTLGEDWHRFAFPRDDLEFLGTIRRGIEIGALAKDTDGNYLQVNGDMRQTLNKSRVDNLLRSAKPAVVRAPVVRQPTADQRAAVVVTVKKRRVIVPNQ